MYVNKLFVEGSTIPLEQILARVMPLKELSISLTYFTLKEADLALIASLTQL